eukprot:COSAG05_NODE_1567_length_4534_cov_4.122886_2_plen_92_part_00
MLGASSIDMAGGVGRLTGILPRSWKWFQIRNAKQANVLRNAVPQPKAAAAAAVKAETDSGSLATALAHLRFAVASDSDSEDDNEIDDDEWD